MANATGFISKTRNNIDAFMRAYQELRADFDKYEKLGGDALLDKYFADGGGDFTPEEWKSMVAAWQNLRAFMDDQGNASLFYQAGS